MGCAIYVDGEWGVNLPFKINWLLFEQRLMSILLILCRLSSES